MPLPYQPPFGRHSYHSSPFLRISQKKWCENSPMQCNGHPTGIIPRANSRSKFRFSLVPSPQLRLVDHLYFMPFSSCEFAGGGCTYGAQVVYDGVGAGGRGCTDSPSWYSVSTAAMATPSAVMLQSRTAFAAFPPIEQPGTAAEVSAMLQTAPPNAPALLFPEGREQPVRMQRSIPVAWTARDLSRRPTYNGAVQPSEHFTFQIAVYAHKNAVTVQTVKFSALTSGETPLPPVPFALCAAKEHAAATCSAYSVAPVIPLPIDSSRKQAVRPFQQRPCTA